MLWRVGLVNCIIDLESDLLIGLYKIEHHNYNSILDILCHYRPQRIVGHERMIIVSQL